jgi:hypothetical protein
VNPVRRFRAFRLRGVRFQGVILAALLLASQTSAWLHAAAVSHATCAEHGEMIHAGSIAPESAHAAAEPSDAALRGDDSTVSRHEHCGSSALLRFRDAALPAPIAVAFSPTVPSSRLRDGVVPLPRGADVYVVAPKTSPPRAGA